MAGPGTHVGLAKMIANKMGREFSNQLITGTLVLDALNAPFGGRRKTRLAGGGACVLPRYNELRNYQPQWMDSHYKESYLVDPITNIRAFEANSIHIHEGD